MLIPSCCSQGLPSRRACGRLHAELDLHVKQGPRGAYVDCGRLDAELLDLHVNKALGARESMIGPSMLQYIFGWTWRTHYVASHTPV